LAATLVTGATGFIGSHVARLLVERGDEVRLGVEDGSPDTAIADLDCKRVKLDVRDRRSVRRALKGVERVFHCAGVTSVRPADEERLFDVNVRGTKLVMEECLRAGVERVVHTSSAAALGPAENGKAATETQLFTAGRLGIPYVNSVHEAEVEAMRVAAHGLPLVCVNPAVCLGAGDHLLSSTRLVRSFLLGRIPVYTDGAIGIVDVRDAAAGHLLADVGGAVGERYLLAGRNFTFERLFADLGRLSGVPTPVRIPPRAAEAAAAVLGAGGRAWPLTPSEVRAAVRRPSRPLSPGTWSASMTASRARAARSRSSTGWPVWRWEPRRARPGWPPATCAGCHFWVKKEAYVGSLRRDSHGPHPACRNAGATRRAGID
jgi:dihydroflavonol-4-reductase